MSLAIEQHRAMLTALLLSDQPAVPKQERPTGSALHVLAERYGLSAPVPGDSSAGPLGLPRGGGRPTDDSSPVIGVDHQACILCDRCVRACDEVQSNEVITRSGKGYATKIAFDLDLPMGSSSCVSCGECMDACPTDALVNKQLAGEIRRPAALKQVELGLPVSDLVRQLGVSEQTYYRWKRAHGGLESDQVRELKQVVEENARLKKLVAELSLDKVVLQDVLSKKFPGRRS